MCIVALPYIYTYACVYTQTHTHTHTHTHVCVDICTDTRESARARVCIYVYIFVYVYVHMCVYSYTCIYECMPKDSFPFKLNNRKTVMKIYSIQVDLHCVEPLKPILKWFYVFFCLCTK